jgi:hypothetical protein
MLVWLLFVPSLGVVVMQTQDITDAVQGCLIDARYGLKQCQKFHDSNRAGDALERIVERLERLEADLVREAGKAKK